MKIKLILFFCLFIAAQARLVNRILQGRDAEPTVFRNLVAIYGRTNIASSLKFIGGGFIYTPDWIILSGSLSSKIDTVYPRELIVVYAGKPELGSHGENEQERSVVDHHTHHEFNPNAIQKSVHLGVVKLNESLEFNRYVAPYLLSSDTSYPEGYAYVAGWGASNNVELNFRTISNKLKREFLEIMPEDECSMALQLVTVNRDMETELTPEDTDRFCSFGISSGPTEGDIGGPIMILNNAQSYSVLGLIYSVPLPTEESGPSFYLQLSHYIGWIVEKTREQQTMTLIGDQRTYGAFSISK